MVLSPLLKRLRRNRSGVALTEFAIAVPFLMLLYVLAYVLCDEIACSRKVTITARELTDLVTRYGTMSTATMQMVMADATQVMQPYPATNAGIRISELQITGATSAQVVWSQAQNATALTPAASVTVPGGVGATGSYVLLGEVTYSYRPPIGLGSLTMQTMTLSDHYYMAPRTAGSIPLTS